MHYSRYNPHPSDIRAVRVRAMLITDAAYESDIIEGTARGYYRMRRETVLWFADDIPLRSCDYKYLLAAYDAGKRQQKESRPT